MRALVKLRKVGDSLVVSLPQAVLRPLGLEPGDQLIVEAAPPRRIILTKEGVLMSSTERLELEIDILQKRQAALKSDAEFKGWQHNSSMPVEPGMGDESIFVGTMRQLARDQAALEVEIAEKHLELYDLQGK
jgi:antitoxin component of MazEF toxin-antitoxin module